MCQKIAFSLVHLALNKHHGVSTTPGHRLSASSHFFPFSFLSSPPVNTITSSTQADNKWQAPFFKQTVDNTQKPNPNLKITHAQTEI